MVDVYLGELNGIDLLRRFREVQPRIYPVIMTANISVETAARAMSEGAVDYVSKPFTMIRFARLRREPTDFGSSSGSLRGDRGS